MEGPLRFEVLSGVVRDDQFLNSIEHMDTVSLTMYVGGFQKYMHTFPPPYPRWLRYRLVMSQRELARRDR